MSLNSDLYFMRLALEQGQTMLGKTFPNPTVGAVLVANGQVIGRGVTQASGRPHAEAMALAEASKSHPAAIQGATLYVTLEPCAHLSPRGPSCADSLIAAGIGRVVGAMPDPDPRTSGQGFERLVAAGIGVEIGLCAQQAKAQHQGFILRLNHGRPMVAVSVDGAGFEAPYRPMPDRSHAEALAHYAAQGYCRLWVEAGSDLASELSALHLLDHDHAKAHQR